MRLMAAMLLIGLLAVPAEAQMRYMGWGDARTGNPDASPDCRALPANHTLVVSFKVPAGIGEIRRIEGFVDFCTDPHPLLEWWRFEPNGGCRAGALAVSADFRQGPFTAEDPWNGLAQVTATFHPQFGGNAVLGRVYVTVAPPAGAEPFVVAGQEYYAFKLVFTNPAVGCGGCEEPACFIVNGLSIVHAGGVFYTDMDYTNYASWQGGQGFCPFIVPARTASWGGVKATFE